MRTRLGPTLTGPDSLLTEIQARRVCTGVNRNANDRHDKNVATMSKYTSPMQTGYGHVTGIGIAIQNLHTPLVHVAWYSVLHKLINVLATDAS